MIYADTVKFTYQNLEAIYNSKWKTLKKALVTSVNKIFLVEERQEKSSGWQIKWSSWSKGNSKQCQGLAQKIEYRIKKLDTNADKQKMNGSTRNVQR